MSAQATRTLSIVAAVLAVAASVALALVPTYSEATGSGITEHRSLPEAEGGWTLALLAAPVLVTMAPLLVRAPKTAAFTRTAAAAVLALFALASIASVGLLYLPAVTFAVLAAAFGWIGRD